ncbi:MAG: hypothetical protein NT070_19225 [Cyanobacteria bacterium]|nr:hypothetical protein [Cyanobacteriota bacterium]
MVTKSTSEQAFENAIALLKERRSALITAAVTGQIALEEMTS